jgi:hypothetical protein
MYFNKDGFSTHCRKYREYEDWLSKRNINRYVDNINHNQKIDCYLENETEFLTYSGWKKFDEINENDLIASFDMDLKLSYDKYIDKFDNLYTGKIHTFEDRYTRFSVTPNHNLFISDVNRSEKNNFSTKYDSTIKIWYFKTVDDYLRDRKNYKFILHNLNNFNIDSPVFTDDFIKIVGLFLSEGSFLLNEKQEIVGITISQLLGGKIEPIINSITEHQFTITKGFRKNRWELSYNLRDKYIANFLKHFCDGHYCNEKDIPSFVFTFSKRQFDIFLESIVSGDGHRHKKGHILYYTTSPRMAKSLHTLCVLNGYNSILMGGEFGYQREYPRIPMFQVFISKNNLQAKCITKNRIKKPNFGWSEKLVEDERIVCFTTKNNTIITRNKHKIAFQGNSKNLLHCRRLLDMAMEIATEGTINVKRPNSDYLLKIKRGEVPLLEIIDQAEKDILLLNDLYKNSNLPEDVNKEFVNDLLLEIRNYKV